MTKSKRTSKKPRGHKAHRRPATTLAKAVFQPKTPTVAADEFAEAVLNGSRLARIKKFAKVEGLDDIEACYDELVGCGHAPDLTSCNFVQLTHITSDVTRSLRRAVKTPGTEVGVQIERFDRVSGAKVETAIKGLHKKSQVFAKAGVSSISSIALLDMPDPSDPSGFAVEPQIRSLVFGVGVEHDIGVMKRAGKASANVATTTLEWIDVADKAALRKAVKMVIAPPLVGDPASLAAAKAIGDERWMKWASLRAFVMLQAFSMLPLKDRVRSQWAGRPVLDASIRAAQMRSRQGAKGETPCIHPDGKVHFWFSELNRLKLTQFTVPLIKLC